LKLWNRVDLDLNALDFQLRVSSFELSYINLYDLVSFHSQLVVRRQLCLRWRAMAYRPPEPVQTSAGSLISVFTSGNKTKMGGNNDGFFRDLSCLPGSPFSYNSPIGS
jgi:hypothetical protein